MEKQSILHTAIVCLYNLPWLSSKQFASFLRPIILSPVVWLALP